MTESEAKQKLCCSPVNGDKCIGSTCMGWRWIGQGEDEGLIHAIKRYRTETGAGLREAKDYVESHPEYPLRSTPTSGFCGLAGKP